jgi:hypothetical protein
MFYKKIFWQFVFNIFSTTYLLLLTTIASAEAPPLEENSNIVPAVNPDSSRIKEEEYIIKPRITPPERINPFTTSFSLNGIALSHLSNWQVYTKYNWGDRINKFGTFNTTFSLDSKVEESLSKSQVFVQKQEGIYVQLQNITQKHTVSTSIKESQNIIGFQIQMSLTGSCGFTNEQTQEQCSYTPGLIVDRNSIDPKFLVPTRVEQKSNFGDIVTKESLAEIKKPGFQRGINGQEIGLDLYFPNVGSISNGDRGNNNTVERTENVDLSLAATVSQFRQVVRANDKKAVIGRTIRGFSGIVGDDKTGINSLVQLSSVILPDADPSLEGNSQPWNQNINQNLFLAANNTRIPYNSLTWYHAGIGQADSVSVDVKDITQVPEAWYNSVWLGLSPVINRTFTSSVSYEELGERRITQFAGGEGGADTNINASVAINNDIFSNQSLQDVYTQIYLTFFGQEANKVSSSTLEEKVTYYPHVSFTGNLTNSEEVWRYYLGAIFSDPIKGYIGTDYSWNGVNNWQYWFAAIGYINPDRDYYSLLATTLTKNIPLSDSTKFSLFTGVAYTLDRPTQIAEIFVPSRLNTVTVGARFNTNRFSFGVTHNFGDILPNSLADRLILDLSWQLSNNFRLSGFYAPIENNTNRSRYGVSLAWKTGDGYNDPAIVFSWNNNEYDFGNSLTQSDDAFSLSIQFGQPVNPFDTDTAERLRRQMDKVK